jgi:hypothetical protein
MKITITDNTNDLEINTIDIIVPCEASSHVNFKYVHFQFEENPNLNLATKFFLNKETNEITDFNFYHIKNTHLLFFRFIYQWGIIDLKTRELKRNVIDKSLDFPFFYFHKKCILIIDDLFAETITLDGNTIDRIPIEQPHEVTEFEDYFEFDIFRDGKRKLMKKK